MAKDHSINVRVEYDMMRWIDIKRAERTLETGRPVSRGDILRAGVTSLAASTTMAPINVMEEDAA